MTTTTRRLTNHSSAQCYIISTANHIDFISYSTRVISIEYRPDGRYIECTGTYSRTTAKQITWFCREYLPELNYYNMKSIVGQGYVKM